MKKHLALLVLSFLFFIECMHSQNIWKPSSGPNSLNIADFVITSGNILVVSAVNDGIYFSKDQGTSWQKISKGLYHADSYATSLATGPGGIIYAIIDLELYRIQDNADEWERTIYKFRSGSEVVANSFGFVFVITKSTATSVLVSKDKGETFKIMLSNKKFVDLQTYLLNGNGNNYFLDYENGNCNLYRINDDGSEIKNIYSLAYNNSTLFWHPSGYVFLYNPFVGLVRMDSIGNNVKKITTNAVVVNAMTFKANGTSEYFAKDGDYESNDFGNTWTKLSSGIYKRVDSGYTIYYDNDNTYVRSAFCYEIELCRTADGGKNWKDFDSYFSNPSVQGLFSDKLDNLFAIACYGGKYSFSSDKGIHWTPLILSTDNLPYSSLVSTTSGNLFVINRDKIYKSQNFGSSWSNIKILGSTLFYGIVGDQGNIVYVSGVDSNFISKDGGENWSPIKSPQNTFTSKHIASHPDGTLFSYEESFMDFLQYSTDGGINWNSTKVQFENLYSLYISNNGNIYLSGSLTPSGRGFYISKDKLETIEHLNDETFPSVVADKNEVLYGVSSANKCKKSTDGGRTWLDFSNGLPSNRDARAVAIDKDQYLYIGLVNDVVYKTTNPVVDPVATKDERKNSEIAIQPNPANEEIKIDIHSKIKLPMSWELYDINGKSILYGEFKSDKSVINTEALPNGIYFLKFGEAKLHVQKLVVEH